MYFVSFDLIGLGPNMGLPFGYYGHFNRVMSHLEARRDLVVVDTVLHRDVTLEDFFITVRKTDGLEVPIRFYGADQRAVSDLLTELPRVGL